MVQMNIIQAVNSALHNMFERDETVVSFGEDAGFYGGVFRCTAGLQEKFGKHRSFDTPLAEGGIVGIAIGMGMNGLRPVAEIQFADYIFPGFDQITNELAKLRYRSGGEYSAPVTIRTPCGGGIKGGHYHSQSPEAYFTHTPGLKVVICSNPYDAKGLLISSIECNDPVIFFEPKRLYNGPFDGDHTAAMIKWDSHPKGEVPEEYYSIPLGKAEIARTGKEVTILCYGTMVHVATAAAENSGIDAEVIDLRSLVPLDIDAIEDSVTVSIGLEIIGISSVGPLQNFTAVFMSLLRDITSEYWGIIRTSSKHNDLLNILFPIPQTHRQPYRISTG